MNTPPERRHPMAEAMEWVARITTVAAMMVVPGLLGQWLDRRLGTSFLVLVGFGLGLVSGIGYLLTMTGVGGQRRTRGRGKDDCDQ